MLRFFYKKTSLILTCVLGAILLIALFILGFLYFSRPDYSTIPGTTPPKFSASTPQTWFWHRPSLANNHILIQRGQLHKPLNRLTSKADEAFANGPFSVTDKTSTPPSGDKHDFYTLSPYFWPNPFTKKPYYFRDGQVNPEAESNQYDRTRYLDFLRTLQKLSLAYYFTGKEGYADRAALLLRTWFITPETRMNPHFNYAQTIPGLTDGLSLGVIRGTELVQILDTLALIQNSQSWTPQDQQHVIDWFHEYLHWVTTDTFGKIESRMSNNHGTWYDAHTAAIALFLNDRPAARRILIQSPFKRIQKQIAPNGSQPHEIKRTRSWYYSIYNLQGLFNIATLAEYIGLDLWHYQGPKGQSLKAALDFLIPYATQQKPWPYPQTSPEPNWVLDFIPLLIIASEKYNDPTYLQIIPQLPPLKDTDSLRLLYTLPENP